MNITVITCPFGELPPNAIGAVEKLFYLLAGEWTNSGHKVTFICAGGGDNNSINHIRIKKYSRTGSTKTDLIWDLLYSIKALWKCPKTDILLCNTFWSPCLAPLFRWKYKRLVYGVHRYPKGQFFLYPFVHRFICVSTVVADALKNELGDTKKVSVINNPIDTQIFTPPIGRETNGDFIVAYSGRVHPEKGLDILFSACERIAKVQPVTLRVFGTFAIDEGGGGDRYVAHLKSLAPDVRIEFVGAIRDNKSLADGVGKCTVFVYPSVASKGETFGVAPLEAMGLGLPVVLSDLQCFGDYAKGDENCLIFNRGGRAIEECADALLKVRMSMDLRMMLRMNAAKTARMFSSKIIASKYIDEFHQSMT